MYADLDRFAGSDLEWALHGSAGKNDSGRLTWFADEQTYDRLDFSLTPGRYQLIVTLAAQARVVVDAEFEMLGCVTAEDGCHSVTFTNPPGNPAVRVRYDPESGEDYPEQDSDKGGEAIIQPGESRAVRILLFEIAWEANAAAKKRGVVYSGAGEHYSQTPDQHCGPTMTRGVVRCAAGERGSVDARLSPPGKRGVRYRVVNEYSGKAVDRGGVGADGRVDTQLPVGSYIFRSYTSDAVLPYDQASFSVPPCVTAVQKCRAVKFANPSEHDIVISYRRTGAADSSKLRIRWGKTKTLPVSSGTLTWRAVRYETDALWRLDPGHGSVRIDPKCR